MHLSTTCLQCSMGRKRNTAAVKRRNKKRRQLKKFKEQVLQIEAENDTELGSSSHPDLPPFTDVTSEISSDYSQSSDAPDVKLSKLQVHRKSGVRSQLHNCLKNGQRDPLVVGLEMLNKLKHQQFYLMKDASMLDDRNYFKKTW